MQGRLTLLLGPPGSGKSSLLKALSGAGALVAKALSFVVPSIPPCCQTKIDSGAPVYHPGRMSASSGVRTSGNITYNGETFASFVPQRTAAYVDQNDNRSGSMSCSATALPLSLCWQDSCLDLSSQLQPCGSDGARDPRLCRPVPGCRLQGGYEEACVLSQS